MLVCLIRCVKNSRAVPNLCASAQSMIRLGRAQVLENGVVQIEDACWHATTCNALSVILGALRVALVSSALFV
jgi:hypothetical protein